MCGGPGRQVKTAGDAQNQLAQKLASQYQEFSGKTTPFYENILANGLPYFNQQSQYSTSDLGKQISQAKANLAGREAGFGSALPSGFAEQEQADLGAQGAQAFDQNQMNLLNQNFLAKQSAASALNPLGPAQAAQSGYRSVLGAAPAFQNNFWSNLLGGVVQGLSSAPFALGVCWIAEVLYGPTDIRTITLRAWLAKEGKPASWKVFKWLYMRFGKSVASLARTSWRLRLILRSLFDLAWRTAEASL